MGTKTKAKMRKDCDQETSEQGEKPVDHSKKVIAQVQAKLGTPPNLDHIRAGDVKPGTIENRYYRVDVIVNTHNEPGTPWKTPFPHSYYVVTDSNGNIQSSNPEIERCYPK